MNFPAALTAQSIDEYVATIARLASDPRWRARCRKAAASADLDAAFFTGDEQLFVDAIRALLARPAVRTAELTQT